jgi:hypothetical protein
MSKNVQTQLVLVQAKLSLNSVTWRAMSTE